MINCEKITKGLDSFCAKTASSLDAAKWNRGFINSEYLDFTTLH